MRATQTILVLGCCGWLAGCGIVNTATHNNLTEARQHAEDHAERKRERQLAEQAWAQWQACHPEHASSEAFADGFTAGFADFLYAGGTGEPPALPPQKYWKIGYETPDGHQAMEDWFAGFRTGANEARQSGARQWVVLPSSGSSAPPATLAPPVAPPAPLPAEPVLPQPRPLPPETMPQAEAASKSPRAEIIRVSVSEPANDHIVPRGSVLGVQARGGH